MCNNESKKELICIGCPMGCMIQLEMEQDKVKNITGYTCPKGKEYALKEVSNPTRIVTSTVKVEHGDLAMLPVKTSVDIPKSKIFKCMEALQGVVVTAPIHIGDVIVTNVAGLNANMVATQNILKK